MSIIGETYEILKDLKSLSEKHNNKEISNKVLELQNKFYELKEENENLKAQIEELKNMSELEEDLDFCLMDYTLKNPKKRQERILNIVQHVSRTIVNYTL